VTVSRADIDTMQVYPTLNFQVSIDWIWRSIARATQTGFSFAVKYLTSNAILFFLLKMWRWFIGFFYCHVLTVVFFSTFTQLEAGIHAQERLLGLVAGEALQRIQEGYDTPVSQGWVNNQMLFT
jgi:hypothetical protein